MKVPVWSRYALALALLGGCSFSPAGAPVGDDDIVDHDAPIADIDARPGDIDARVMTDAAAAVDIAYLDPPAEVPGTGDWTVETVIDFDTDLDPGAPDLEGLPAGVTFTIQNQVATNARPLLVMHVRKLDIRSGGGFGLYGSRALAIVAGAEVIVAGTIDASAAEHVPGPGGFGNTDVAGAGGGGNVPITGATDTGGGGGGHGTGGGRGGGGGCAGACIVAPGGGGTTVNDDMFYLGGGGRGGVAPTRSNCIARPPGAGGGGLLIYSPTSIIVTASGIIEANGGGGGGGRYCPSVATLAGSGGGAGGQIELQSPTIGFALGARVIANGGAGGGGANNNNNQSEGATGGNGAMSLTVATSGGAGGGTGGNGGAGSIGAGLGGNGTDVELGANGGGGGGGGGRIMLRHRGAQPPAITSPPAKFAVY